MEKINPKTALADPDRLGKYLVGIEYEARDESYGYFELKRTGTLRDVALEIQTILTRGHRYPSFPPAARPAVLFAWELTAREDGDVYGQLLEILADLPPLKKADRAEDTRW